jgi:hypothetical protein
MDRREGCTVVRLLLIFSMLGFCGYLHAGTVTFSNYSLRSFEVACSAVTGNACSSSDFKHLAQTSGSTPATITFQVSSNISMKNKYNRVSFDVYINNEGQGKKFGPYSAYAQIVYSCKKINSANATCSVLSSPSIQYINSDGAVKITAEENGSEFSIN